MSKKVITSFLFGVFLIGFFSGGMMAAQAPSVDPEAGLRGLIAKYAAVFRLIPNRVSQMLQVVSAYPSEGQSRRADLLQLVIHRMHEKYRVVQQLQNRVLEVQGNTDARNTLGVYGSCASLLDAIKKYQVTLISILSVLDAEFVRSVKAAGGRSHDVREEDAAFVAAKKALSPNHIDAIIDSLSEGQPIEEALYGGSVKSELRQLRNEVSLLSAQLQAKALLEKGATANEKDFGDQVTTLNAQNIEALSSVKEAVGSLGDDSSALVEQGYKKHSYRTVSRVGLAAETVQDKARLFQVYVGEHMRSIYGWIIARIASLYAVTYALFSRVFSDSQRAAEHVGNRLQEVKDVTPEGFALAKESIRSCASWLVDSWLRVGRVVVDALRPLGQYWVLLQEKAAGFDQAMRMVVCGLIASAERGLGRLVAVAGEFKEVVRTNFGAAVVKDEEGMQAPSGLSVIKKRFAEGKEAFISCVSLYTESTKQHIIQWYEKAKAAVLAGTKTENL